MKFFHLKNCNRIVTLGSGQTVQFAPYDLTGTWMGVYATDDEKQAAELELLVANPKSGMTAIPKSEYDSAIRQKKLAATSYAPSMAVNIPTPGESAKSEPAIEPNLAPTPSEPAPAPLESVDQAVEVVPVQKKKAKK